MKSAKELKTPPAHILGAALRVLHVCGYTTRNWTIEEYVSREQINDVGEAIHPIPDLLGRWRPGAEEELLMYFGGYNEKWESPDLLVIYKQEKDMLLTTSS